LAAIAVFAREGDPATVVDLLALARIAADFDIADLLAIDRAAARAASVTNRFAECFEVGTASGVIAAAFDAKTAFALLELQRALGLGQHGSRHCLNS